MKPTRTLENEHRIIERVLDCLDRMADRCESERSLDATSARQAIDFFRSFADRCHHGKEEAHLFPLMESRGFPPHDGPLAVMRVEHDHGRVLVRGMEAATEGAGRGDPRQCAAWIENAHRFSALLREHIRKEDHCLFPMADRAFAESDQTELAAVFDRVDREEIGSEEHARCLRLADDLADRFGVRNEPAPTTSS